MGRLGVRDLVTLLWCKVKSQAECVCHCPSCWRDPELTEHQGMLPILFLSESREKQQPCGVGSHEFCSFCVCVARPIKFCGVPGSTNTDGVG